MTDFPKWSEVRAGVVAAAGGEEAVAEARKRNQAYIDGHRLAERRKAVGLWCAATAPRGWGSRTICRSFRQARVLLAI
ncbi:hypothetical protein [Actinomadura latina]|uniref:hypothetical protein n=1 Tax=Actinomadura latina TaxID=163603 RepID=UPI000A414616|nr:hypothetical protein [Actinomadura latina]